jgi:hypothetical protein
MPSREQIYRRLVEALRRGDLQEPFTTADLQRVYPGLSKATYRAFLRRHSGGDAETKKSPLLERIPPKGFRLVRPFRDVL